MVKKEVVKKKFGAKGAGVGKDIYNFLDLKYIILHDQSLIKEIAQKCTCIRHNHIQTYHEFTNFVLGSIH